MDYTKFSGTYTVRRLLRDDIPSIFALCEKNPQFYEHCPPFVTPEKIEADLKAMPQRKAGQEQDKYYLGYFDIHQRLVAVMDFIDHYPDAKSGFIGFFMMEKDLQGTGVGSSIIKRPLELKIEPSGLNWQKLEKRGFFHSPVFHITCIIRNMRY